MITTFDQLREKVEAKKEQKQCEREPVKPNFECDTQRRIYRYIVNYKAAHNGNSPSYRQIMAEVGLATVSTIKNHLEALEQRGLLRQEQGSRGIVVVGSKWIPPESN